MVLKMDSSEVKKGVAMCKILNKKEQMTYIHADTPQIQNFICENIRDTSNLKIICDTLFTWFDENVTYSRLNAPFFPLQRSDLDVISMQFGTCGDYANLLVSVLLTLGYEAKYAYVHRDCYGDEQDHICVAVREDEQWILIDATQPYRKWHGFHCPHQEYELLSPCTFEEKMKKEEYYWFNVANGYGNKLFAGLLYAPWIHEEIIRETVDALESVFFLLLLDEKKNVTLYAYYKQYSKEQGNIPVMSISTKEMQKFCFSCRNSNGIWDAEQWSEAYLEKDIPSKFISQELSDLRKCVFKVLPEINKWLSILGIEKLYSFSKENVCALWFDYY